MSLARTWTRSLLGASSVALLAPGALLAALVVLAAGGGLGGLRSFEQVFSGPAVPPATVQTTAASTTGIPLAPVLSAGEAAAVTRPLQAPAPRFVAATGTPLR